ncbi:MAG: ATP-binding cassette domain-containing protein [Holosporales bacterium]|nr:ATP-binding cassette domain-containing protein [Holosporales bacterium]
MLEMRNICVRNTLKNLDLEVALGEFVLIIGANGTGKTTLFNVISGALPIENGIISLNGIDITDTPRHVRARRISSVIQDPRRGTIGEMSILENLRLAYNRSEVKGEHNLSAKKKIEYFKEKLSIINMNLEDRLDEYVGNLSGGQRQALSLIMATITGYDLLLLDEITASLDSKMADTVMTITNDIVKKEQKTCLLITHNTKHIDMYGTRILKMKDGKLV